MVPKPIRVVVTATVVLLALVAGGAVRNASRDPEQPAGDVAATIEVSVVQARAGVLSQALSLTGEVRAIREASIRAEASGRVEAMPWRIGDRVGMGDVLARLDGSRNQIAIHKARAQLSQAQTALEKARRKRERAQALFDGRKISVEKHDDAVFAHLQAESSLAMRRAELESLERMARDFEIRAPYDAHLSQIYLQLGDLASPGMAAFSLVEATGTKAVFKVPAEQIGAFGRGDDHEVFINALGRSATGRVAAIGMNADPKSRTFILELDLAPGLAVRPGMIARIDVRLDSDTPTLFIPGSAIVEKFGGSYLFVVRDQFAEEIPVQIDQRSGAEVAVSGDLLPGAQVVIRGQHRLANGDAVSLALDEDGGEAPGR